MSRSSPHRTDAARRAGTRRGELVKALAAAGREQSAVTVMFHSALAEKLGLSATEEKALDLLDRFGPLTAGELAERSGLAPASVTGLVDRLERKGFARRVPHPKDRRRVLVEADAARLRTDLAPLFADWARTLDELWDSYTDDELELLLRFLTQVTRRQQEAAARLAT